MKRKQKQILEVAAIKQGTVLDHLPGDKVLQIVELLSCETHSPITLGINLESKKLRAKGIIKLSARNLTEAEMNKIAIIAPDATVNTIENYDVVKKKKIVLRNIEPNTLFCTNPSCITNAEKTITRFHLLEKNPLKIQCFYCERILEKNEIKFLIS